MESVPQKEETVKKYSLSDSDGRQLTAEQQEYFKDSKMRDDADNLMVMYHGSENAGFHVFDPKMSDDDTSLFFVDRNDVAASYSGTSETYEAKTIRTAEDMRNFLESIGYEGYEVIEEGGKIFIEQDGDYVAGGNTAQELYEEFCWYEGIGEGDANYKVYLNLKNPLVVDAKDRPWNRIPSEYSEELYNKYKSLTAEERNALVELADWEDWSVFKDEILAAKEDITLGAQNPLSTAIGKLMDEQGNISISNLFSIASANFTDEAISENAFEYLNTRQYAQKAKEQGYDGVIFNNIHDNGGYSNGSEGASTVAIAFDSNQIKSVANEKPTADRDIRYSLSDSEGRKLSDGQAAYFKGSKVTDENGNLKAVYHGSPSDFNTFSLDYLGTNGTAEGYGFYFTDSKSIAENYSKGREGQQNGEPGRLFEVYLDIKKPLSDTEVTMSRAQFKKFLTELNKQVDADGERLDVLSNYGDVEWEGLNNVLNYAMEIEYDGSDSDVNMIHSIINGCGDMKTVFRVLRKTLGYDGIIVNEATWGGDQTIYIAFHPEQIKNVDNLNPTTDADIRRSLSDKGEQFAPVGRNSTPARDLRLEVAPVAETAAPGQNVTVAENTTVADMFPDDYAPVIEDDSERLDSLTDADVPPEVERHDQKQAIAPEDPFEERDWFEVGKDRKAKAYMYENPEVKPFFQEEARILWGELDNTQKGERWFNSGDFGGYGAESYYRFGGTKRYTSQSMETLLDEWGMSYAQIEKGLKAIVEDNGAENIADAKHIEFMLNDRLLNGYNDFFTGDYIPPNQDYINLLNEKQINEYSKEAFDAFMANADTYAPPVEETAAPVAPVAPAAPAENVAPIAPEPETAKPAPEEQSKGKTAKIVYGRTEQPKTQSAIKWAREHIFRRGAVFEDLDLKRGGRELSAKFDNIRRSESAAQHFIANGDGEVSSLKSVWEAVEESGKVEAFNEYLYHLHNVDRMSLETPENKAERERLAEKFKGYPEKQIADTATDWITKDTPPEVVARIKAARAYLESLKGRNKPVWGEEVTADISRKTASKLEAENPEFKQYAEEIYGINKYLRQMLVEDGEITQATADLWEKMYPHYVPIKRVDKDGKAITVPLDTNRTGVNAPIKRATGGNSDFYDVFGAMSDRIEQTYRAVARNRFGVELKNTLNTVVEEEAEKYGILPEGTRVRAHDRDNIGTVKSYNEKTGKYTVHFENKKGYAANAQIAAKLVTPLNPVKTDSDMDSVLDSVDEALLQEGKNGQAPTFTVFEKGKRVKFAITEDMYEAMKPSAYTYNNKVLNKISDIRRDTLTKYSPKFMITNPMKDLGDVIVNSQHPARTYMAIPKAVKEIMTNGQYHQERLKHGGGQDSYFDNRTLTFKKEEGKFAKIVGKFGRAQEILEQVPRLAEYIASREMGRSIDVSMLDAGRVTTNFGASGDFTNMLNRNGFTFLSASVEGFNQQVRNIREAKAEGLKGWAKLAGKYLAAGLPVMLLNHALWDDDEEYEELSDYVKQNYYIVGKFGDGKFVRIPKGRAVAVIQNAFKQMENLITGDDDVDLEAFANLVKTNLAPNDPFANNIISPIIQVKNNKTWYGDDLIPSRLQDVPAGEQFDETTDAISRWLGETFNISPIKANYLFDQYGGIVSDIGLPMMTPKAESGDDNPLGKLIAPIRDAFTTDSVLKNQNVADFYEKVDELTTNANAMAATDDDALMSKYINSVSAEMGELYGKKREIQSSDLSNSEKYEAVREIQRQIDELAEEGLNTYQNLSYEDDYREGGEYARIGDRVFKKNDEGEWSKLSDEQLTKYEVTKAAGDSSYATDGENHYRWYVPGEDADADAEPGWRKVTKDELKRQKEVTSGLDITPEEYWSNKEEYSYAYDNPENYAVARAVGGYESFKGYNEALYDIKADKDASGNSITGSRKEKVVDYLNNLDADYYTKIILFKNEYNADDTYNYEIIEYLNGREDISYQDMETILKKLGFEVDSNGNISW